MKAFYINTAVLASVLTVGTVLQIPSVNPAPQHTIGFGVMCVHMSVSKYKVKMFLHFYFISHGHLCCPLQQETLKWHTTYSCIKQGLL